MSGSGGSTKQSNKSKFKRKLTPFLCREMLFDYATGTLDTDRRAAIDDFLKTDKECQEILEEIRKGIEYTERLAMVQIKPSVLTEIGDAEDALSLSRRYASWREWPETLRWSITAVMISTILAGAIAVVPWKNIPVLRAWVDSTLKPKRGDLIEIAQLPRPSEEAQIEAVQEQQEGAPIDEGSGDEETEIALEALPDTDQAPASTPPPTALANALAMVQPSPTPNLLQASPGQLQPSLAAKETTRGVPTSGQRSQPNSEQSVAIEVDVEKSSTTHRDSKPKGYVSRAFMTLANLDEIGPKIVDHIVELGGEKAGEVELGWQRGTGRYYHFALPEENHEKLLEKLRAYGPVRISKDPHPRIMPEGQVRFILWIEAGNI